MNAVGLPKAVEAHVLPNTAEAKQFYARSEFVSFTANPDRALVFAAGGRGKLEASPELYGWTAVVFELDVTGMSQTLVPGLYLLRYQCNYSTEHLIPNYPGDDGEDQAAHVECLIGHGRTGGMHKALLVDVVEYLTANPEYSSRPEALGLAKADAEWLVFPLDPLNGSAVTTARIPPTTILTARRYRLAGGDSARPKEA